MPSLLDRMQSSKAPPPQPAPQPAPPPPPALRAQTEQVVAAAPAPAPDPQPVKPAVVAVEPRASDVRAARGKIRKWVLERMQPGVAALGELTNDNATLAMLHERFLAVYKTAGINAPADEVQEIERLVMDEILGFGPIEPLLQDPTVTEVMVNGPRHIYIEQKGMVHETDVQFDDDAHVMRIIERIVRPLGRRVDRRWPMVDGRLPDGSRVNIIIPPGAIDGPTITIRKFSKKRLDVDSLIEFGSLSPNMSEFLRACVIARLNIVVAGGTGSGKTTFLNVLSNFIPDHERIVTIEDSAELQLAKPHVVRLEARPADPDGTGRITIRDLVTNALRMRPERIVVGEVRDAATLDMLQAMNTGHDGSLTTLHANSPRDAISRLETMALMAGIDFPIKVIREQIAAAIDLIIQQARLRDGSRKITLISEVQGMEGDIIVLQDVFRFVEMGVDAANKVMGEFQSSGIRPKFLPRLEAAGVHLPITVFTSDAPSLRGLEPRGSLRL